MRPDFVSEARDSAREREEEEENRLLYVALTRARDGIVIGGRQAQHRRRLEASHYERLHAAVSGKEGVETDADGRLRLETEVLCQQGIGAAGTAPVEDSLPVPDWLFRDARKNRARHARCARHSLMAGRRPRAPEAALPPRGHWPVDGSRTAVRGAADDRAGPAERRS